jgi:hypothetical protein
MPAKYCQATAICEWMAPPLNQFFIAEAKAVLQLLQAGYEPDRQAGRPAGLMTAPNSDACSPGRSCVAVITPGRALREKWGASAGSIELQRNRSLSTTSGCF